MMRYGDSFEKGFQAWNRAKTIGYELERDVWMDETACPHHFKPIGEAPPMENGSHVPGWLRQQLCLYESFF